ncbi:MAG TPA: calcium/sodium antiporter [Myxococcota bacterium]|nr:calcium/sodium antiporter [Myxococcota bacterium]
MTQDLLLACAGLALLLVGGDVLVRGASRLAASFGMSPLAVGLTVVAFGTSAPELAVNVLAAVRDSGGLSFGNVVGSNLANIGLIFGIGALFRPIPIQDVVVRREIPMMLLATAAAMGLAFDHWLDGEPTFFDRGDGITLLLFFFVFLYYTIGELLDRRARAQVTTGSDLAAHASDVAPGRPLRDVGLVIAGVAMLALGADVTVDAATSLARAMGVPEVIIGLTLVAIGTSLPELAATVMAILRNESALAVGNVVGSNIFNLLLVGGLTATIRPIPIPEGAAADLVILAAMSLLLWGVSMSRGQKILRAEGVVLLTVYLTYVSVRVLA